MRRLLRVALRHRGPPLCKTSGRCHVRFRCRRLDCRTVPRHELGKALRGVRLDYAHSDAFLHSVVSCDPATQPCVPEWSDPAATAAHSPCPLPACAVDDETGKFSSDPKLTFQHPYPPTKIMFIPDKENSRPDLLATTGDFLRIWQVSDDGVQLHKLLNNVRPPSSPVGMAVSDLMTRSCASWRVPCWCFFTSHV